MDNPSNAEYTENVAAIAEAIQDFEAGDRGQPAGKLSQELRERFEIGEP